MALKNEEKAFKISAKSELSPRKSFFLCSRWVCMHHQHEMREKGCICVCSRERWCTDCDTGHEERG